MHANLTENMRGKEAQAAEEAEPMCPDPTRNSSTSINQLPLSNSDPDRSPTANPPNSTNSPADPDRSNSEFREAVCTDIGSGIGRIGDAHT